MAQYELSIDPDLVQQAEQLITLEGRGFPTIVVMWESEMLGQEWQTILVLDYSFPLPPLAPGETFNEVRVGAYTGEVPTKFLYFGTELNADAPRVAPEMENLVSPAKTYQEYRLTEESTAIPYLELIHTTPRIYGNGPQDYYSPPIKVERFDAGAGSHLIADNFPEVVANLAPIDSDTLTDARRGFWQGSRFVGTKRMAIVRNGEVVGLRRRTSDKEIVPPEVIRRDPKEDVRHDAWVAIDLGASKTVVAIGENDHHELVRIGATRAPKIASDFEIPSQVNFSNLPRITKAWRDRVILPLTEWGDVYVGHGAAEALEVAGKERAHRQRCTLGELGTLPLRFETEDKVPICGRSDPDSPLFLEKPAPPIIDEEGIDPDDPFDPLELFGYYIGLNVNTRSRGIILRYAVGMPTGWPAERREQVLSQFRRGILRSLPAGMVAYDDTDFLQVVDGGPNVLSFAAYAFRVFGIQLKGDEPIPFVSIDAGASETAVLCGQLRAGKPDEVAAGYERIVEHVEPVILNAGGEVLLHRLAYKVYAASASSMKNNDIPFPPPAGEEPLEGAEERMVSNLNAVTNVQILKDAVRPLLEKAGPSPVPDLVQLFDAEGRLKDVRIMVDRAALNEWLRGQLSEVAVQIKEAIAKGFEQVSRGEAPYADLRVFLGGRMSMHPFLQERVEAVLPKEVRIHKFREPDATNLEAPTVKLATALGILALRFQPMAPSEVQDDRASFNYRVGRSKRGKLLTVLDDAVGYDVWREMGACTRPEVTILYADSRDAEGDMSSDDPSIQRAVCNLGYDAVGYRVYLRAVGGHRVEVSVGPPGGRPDDDAPSWAVDLSSGSTEPLSQ